MKYEKSAEDIVGTESYRRSESVKTRDSDRRLIEDGVAERMKKNIPNVRVVFSV
jgi:hypothetical protein